MISSESVAEREAHAPVFAELGAVDVLPERELEARLKVERRPRSKRPSQGDRGALAARVAQSAALPVLVLPVVAHGGVSSHERPRIRLEPESIAYLELGYLYEATAVVGDTREYLVDLELTALESEGRGEIVSTPRVITANQKEARIEQGVEIPYQESASSGATTTQFKKAVLALTVTPQITPDNNIIMDLLVSKDNVGELTPSATGGLVPSIDTRAVETQVLVRDGQTVVLGGIYETERRETINKVPFLGDLPGLGTLFRSTSDVSNKAELLIFVTPRILSEGTSVY